MFWNRVRPVLVGAAVLSSAASLTAVSASAETAPAAVQAPAASVVKDPIVRVLIKRTGAWSYARIPGYAKCRVVARVYSESEADGTVYYAEAKDECKGKKGKRIDWVRLNQYKPVKWTTVKEDYTEKGAYTWKVVRPRGKNQCFFAVALAIAGNRSPSGTGTFCVKF